eukprot:scaffold522267_cov25-Prasinocladus_malaysianus.AAC.1
MLAAGHMHQICTRTQHDEVLYEYAYHASAIPGSCGLLLLVLESLIISRSRDWEQYEVLVRAADWLIPHTRTVPP